jgi:hypothetical protein
MNDKIVMIATRFQPKHPIYVLDISCPSHLIEGQCATAIQL